MSELRVLDVWRGESHSPIGILFQGLAGESETGNPIPGGTCVQAMTRPTDA